MSAQGSRDTAQDPRLARCLDCGWVGMVNRGPRDKVPPCHRCGGLTEALPTHLRYPCPDCGYEATIKSPHEEHAWCRREHLHEEDEAVACPPRKLVDVSALPVRPVLDSEEE